MPINTQVATQPGEERVSEARAFVTTISAPAPDRPSGEGTDSFARLIIKDVMLIDGRGSPPPGPVSVGGVRYTIKNTFKNGIVYDARALLADVRKMVVEAREK